MGTLQHHPIVKRAWLQRKWLSVKYTTNIIQHYIYKNYGLERYGRRNLTEDDIRVTNIRVAHEYYGKDNQLDNYFKMPRAWYDKCTIVERDLLYHTILNKLVATKYLPDIYTEYEIELDLRQLHDTQLRELNNDTLRVYNHTKYPKPGLPTIERYLDIGDIPRRRHNLNTTLNYAYSSQRIIRNTLNHIIKHTDWDLTITSINHALNRLQFGPLYINPVVYRTIMHHCFDLYNRVVVDPHPAIGYKALACSTFNTITYAPIKNDLFNNNFYEHLKLPIINPQPPYDIVLYDNGFRTVNLDKAFSILAQTKEMALFIRNHQYDEAMHRSKPQQILKLRMGGIPIIDYLFIYRQK